MVVRQTKTLINTQKTIEESNHQEQKGINNSHPLNNFMKIFMDELLNHSSENTHFSFFLYTSLELLKENMESQSLHAYIYIGDEERKERERIQKVTNFF